jgi:predicted nuclease with TOPRIM domain
MNWEIVLAASIPALLSLIGVIYSRSVDRRNQERAGRIDEKVRKAETTKLEVEALNAVITTLQGEIKRNQDALQRLHGELEDLRQETIRCDLERQKLQDELDELKASLNSGKPT